MTMRVDELGTGTALEEGNGDNLEASAKAQSAANLAPLEATAFPDFVETPYITNLLESALAVAECGFPVHFRGPTGCGKTTLAVQLAHRLGRPLMMLVGDDEFSTSDLIGGQSGYERKRVIDNFIHSVMKTEDRVDYRWVDARLTVACEQGHTLIYDEFNRSRPEANNILLPVLEERILILPTLRSRKGYLRVHPDFTCIFTSNPKEYVGVHSSQDALLDRMVTVDLGHFDRETEIAITSARSGISKDRATKIVDLIRNFRQATDGACDPTLRNGIMLGSIMARQDGHDGLPLEQVCLTVLSRDINPGGKPDQERRQILLDLVHKSKWD